MGDRIRDTLPRSRDIPGRLGQRKARRTLRSVAGYSLLLLAVIVGVLSGMGGGIMTAFIAIGQSFAGLLAFGAAGLIIGVLLTAGAVFVYNRVIKGNVSLIDLDFIDEVPLVFLAVGGTAGIFLAGSWPDIFGLIGWGFALLTLTEVIFRQPADD